MKIKITTDIPRHKKGSVLSSDSYIVYNYDFHELIEGGFAEIVPEEIDIDAIREEQQVRFMEGGYMSHSDCVWFSAYRIVSEVIKQLNGDWTPNWEDDDQKKYFPCVDMYCESLFPSYNEIDQMTIIPHLKDKASVETIISLCRPELEILFGVKK